jgi:hypothetical protein
MAARDFDVLQSVLVYRKSDNITTGIEERSSRKPGPSSTLLSNGEHAKNDKTAG